MTKISNSIVGYVEANKNKDGYEIGSIAKFEEIDPKQVIKLKRKLSDLLKKKEDKLFPVVKEEELIKRKLRPSINNSIEMAYKHYLETTDQKTSEELEEAFALTKAINILTGTAVVNLLVKSEYDGKEEPIVYTDNIMIYREVVFNPMVLREALKENLPAVYENVKEIQEFPNAKLEELDLKKNEIDMIMSIKKRWKAIPTEKIKIIKAILSRIRAFKELEGC